MSVVGDKGRVSAMSGAGKFKIPGGGRSTAQSSRAGAVSRTTVGTNMMATINEKGTVQGDPNANCQICSLRAKQRQAMFYCTACNMPLCQFCHNQHKATKVTADHPIIQKRDKSLNEQVCTLHRFAAIQYYCDDCCKFVCVNCTMLEHRGHKVVEITEKVEECKTALKESIGSLDFKITMVNQELRKAQEAVTQIELNRKKIKEDVTKKVDALVKKLRAQEGTLIKSVDDYLDVKLDYIVKRKEVMQGKFEGMMAVRMANDLNRIDMRAEKFITDTMDAQAKIAKWKEEKPMDESDLKKMKIVITNNGELGRMETSNEPLFSYKTLSMKSLPPPPGVIFNDGGSTNRSNNKLVPALDLYQGDPSPRGAILQRKDYQTVKMMCKFRTTSYVQKPSGIAVLPNGRFVIADANSYGLVIADKTGRFQQRLFQDDVIAPQGVAVDKKGHIFVTTDRYVKKFKAAGTKIGQFSAYPTPGSIAVDSQGRIIISDVKARHITIYDEDGRALTKFYTTDKTGNGPDAYNLAVDNDQIALSYQSLGISYFVRVFNYEGKMLFSAKIPEKCRGLEMDKFGNIVVASGELAYLSTGGQNLLPLTTLDKSNRLYTIHANQVAFTPDGMICTLHMNTVARRSEFAVLQMGRNVTASC